MTDPQVDATHYWSREYLTRERVSSFWHQLDAVLEYGPRTVLEVGPGPGIVTGWLRGFGIEVVTLDHAADIDANIRGSVTEIPLADDGIDVTLCAQVLEHLPWRDVSAALSELARVSRLGIVLTLPDLSPYAAAATPLYWGYYVDRVREVIPTSRRKLARALLSRQIRLRDWLFVRIVPARWGLGGATLSLPSWMIPHVAKRHRFDGQHYWELGTDISLDDFIEACTTAGLELVKAYRVAENPYHHVLVVSSSSGRRARGSTRT